MKVKVKVLSTNQFIIESKEGTYFQSYSSVIAFIDKDGYVFLDEERWDYSRTTLKYLGRFLNKNLTEIRKKIITKEYNFINLN